MLDPVGLPPSGHVRQQIPRLHDAIEVTHAFEPASLASPQHTVTDRFSQISPVSPTSAGIATDVSLVSTDLSPQSRQVGDLDGVVQAVEESKPLSEDGHTPALAVTESQEMNAAASIYAMPVQLNDAAVSSIDFDVSNSEVQTLQPSIAADSTDLFNALASELPSSQVSIVVDLSLTTLEPLSTADSADSVPSAAMLVSFEEPIADLHSDCSEVSDGEVPSIADRSDASVTAATELTSLKPSLATNNEGTMLLQPTTSNEISPLGLTNTIGQPTHGDDGSTTCQTLETSISTDVVNDGRLTAIRPIRPHSLPSNENGMLSQLSNTHAKTTHATDDVSPDQVVKAPVNPAAYNNGRLTVDIPAQAVLSIPTPVILAQSSTDLGSSINMAESNVTGAIQPICSCPTLTSPADTIALNVSSIDIGLSSTPLDDSMSAAHPPSTVKYDSTADVVLGDNIAYVPHSEVPSTLVVSITSELNMPTGAAFPVVEKLALADELEHSWIVNTTELPRKSWAAFVVRSFGGVQFFLLCFCLVACRRQQVWDDLTREAVEQGGIVATLPYLGHQTAFLNGATSTYISTACSCQCGRLAVVNKFTLGVHVNMSFVLFSIRA